MRIYKEKTVKVLDQTICDVCGKTCTDDFYNEHENATLLANWGYNSNRDGIRFDIHLCENCFGDTLGFLIEKRKEYGFNSEHDAFSGYEYPIQ